MLITFIINGGDIAKLVSYIDEEFILADRFFVYLILGRLLDPFLLTKL